MRTTTMLVCSIGTSGVREDVGAGVPERLRVSVMAGVCVMVDERVEAAVTLFELERVGVGVDVGIDEREDVLLCVEVAEDVALWVEVAEDDTLWVEVVVMVAVTVAAAVIVAVTDAVWELEAVPLCVEVDEEDAV